MAHTLVVGTTESGKTLLAKEIAARWIAEGLDVLVLDPKMQVWPGAAFITDDPEMYLDEVAHWEGCLLVVDESGTAIGHYGGVMRTLGTDARHESHSSVFVAQRATQLDPIIRDQCRYCAVFLSSAKAAVLMDDEFPRAGFRRASELDFFEYLWASRHGGEAVLRRVHTPWLDSTNPEET